MTHDESEQLERQIGWEKWRDPWGSDANESEWPGAWGTFETDELLRAAQKGEEVDGEDFDDNDIDYTNDEMERQYVEKKQVKVGIMNTPMGIIPMTEHTTAGNIFNFWTAHTNFRITTDIIETIDNTEGVESFDLFTPYRWRIAIGKAFNSCRVKDRLMKNLRAQPINESGV